VFLLLWSFQGARGRADVRGPSKLNSVNLIPEATAGEACVVTGPASRST